MSIKTTRYISREEALVILNFELMGASDKMLGDLLDAVADSGEGKSVSIFDNFIVE